MSAQSPDKIGLDKIGKKIGLKKNFWGVAPGPKEFMKYVQYFPDQSPQTNIVVMLIYWYILDSS